MKNQMFDAIAHRLPLTTSRRDIARTGGSVLATAVLARFRLSPSGSLAAKSGTCKKPCGECELCNPAGRLIRESVAHGDCHHRDPGARRRR